MKVGASVELYVVSYAGAEAGVAGALRIGGSPSSIGRSPACHLSLDDPERLISRAHLAVWLDAAGNIHLKNTSGTTPAFVEGQELAPGATRTVLVGQSVVVGRYLLAVREEAAQPIEAAGFAAAPRVEMFGPLAAIPAEFDVFASPADTAGSSAAGGTASRCSLDDFSELGEASAALLSELPAFDARGPQVDLLSGFEPSSLQSSDPISDVLGPPRPSTGQIGPNAYAAAGAEIDGLFVLPAGVSLQGVAPSDLPPASGAADVDPLPLASPAVRSGRHNGAEAFQGLLADVGDIDVLALINEPAEPASASAEATQAHTGSFGAPSISGARAVDSAFASLPPDPVGAAQGIEPAASNAPAGPDSNALQRAFARGCGIPAERISEFDEQAVEDIGRLLAALVGGALQLVHARSSTKHEMRANVTIIASSGNNPLKFAPDASAALMQLLGRGLPGFMPPREAVVDAFEDLCAHQVGLLAASRSAMYAVAARLSPDRLQEVAGGPRGFSGLLPSAHKARLWDLYLQSHADLLGEAREEFDAVFQNAFVRAYEGEVQRLQAGAAS